ncbi:glycosyltransferase family protein [Candidatus Nitronereus thalassa]|uniref:Glycosyltransferase n=1 Tax=Candidatus Nitronereus thalassa TaxID=3020898 RepID=A0ABU3K5V7_9BACT|nr:glycosyltransferase [Candidatus Nitronereus thalassa]MDT7041802.1 glycosyltransferase [Candidatus Nitronereus thalassa]
MKILFITLPDPDHQTDQLYTGLCSLLGSDKVVDFPSKPTYHDPAAKIWFVPQASSPPTSQEEIMEGLRERQFSCMCFAPRPVAFKTLDALQKSGIPLPPLILFDGEEDSRIRHELLARYPIQLYFKRDYVWGTRNRAWDFIDATRAFHWNRSLFARTHPLPLAVALPTIPPIPDMQKTFDISYTGRSSHPCRPKVVNILRRTSTFKFDGGLFRDPYDQTYKMKGTWIERAKDKYLPSIASPPPYEVARLSPSLDHPGIPPYFHQIFQSKIAVSLRGGGLTPPIRYYEIVACKTLLLSDIPYSVIPNNFIHKVHAVFFKRNLTDIVELVEYYLRHDAERQEIIEQGYQHLIKYHTCEKRAEYFLDICRKAL